MKKIFKNLALVAAAVMGFTACQKEIQNEVPVKDSTVQVTFVAGSADTKMAPPPRNCAIMSFWERIPD